MTEELEQLLKNLKLRRMLEIYDEQLRAADKDDISYSDFVTRLVREYPREPLLGAVREAGRYGLYDLDRLERMILRRVTREYFLLEGEVDDD